MPDQMTGSQPEIPNAAEAIGTQFSQPPATPQRQIPRLKAVGILLAITALVVGAYLAGSSQRFVTLQTADPNNEKSSVASPLAPSLNDGSELEKIAKEPDIIIQRNTFAFIRDDSAWISVNGVSRQVSLAGQYVRRVAYNNRTNQLAYIWGEPENNGHASYGYPHTATLLNLDTQQPTDVYQENIQKGAEIGNGEYLLEVKGVLFSQDGKTLIVTTSDSVYSYDIDTAATKRILTNRADPEDWKSIVDIGKGQVYGFMPIAFSANEQYLLLESLHYEWATSLIIDVSSSQPIPLSQRATNFDSRVIGWHTNEELLLIKRKPGQIGVDLAEAETSVSLYNLRTQEERQLALHKGQIGAAVVTDDVAYYLLSAQKNGTARYSLESIDLTNLTKKTIAENLAVEAISNLKTGRSPAALLLQDSRAFGGPSATKSIYELNLKTNELDLLEENAAL